MNWVPALAPLEKVQPEHVAENSAGNLGCLFLSIWKFLIPKLHQSKSALTAASGKTQAAKQRYGSTSCTPLDGTASLFTALIFKAYSIKGFHFIFSTV